MKHRQGMSPSRLVALAATIASGFLSLAAVYWAVSPAIARTPVSQHAGAEASSKVHKTKVKKVSPLNSKGKVRKGFRVEEETAGGTCSAGSHAIGAAFRCVDSGEHALYDPCWYSHDETMMFCWAAPWAREVTRFFPYIESELHQTPINRSHPWGVRLTSGERCQLVLGSTSAVDGKAVRWGCGGRLALLDDLNRTGDLWSLSAVTYDASTSTYALAGTREVAIAWFGRRSRNP